jgi:FHS family L-fucose permease-like MFS transporter
LNVAATLLVFCKLGWLSVACVFLSYFFMSIMFPTIFALGIFGLGARAKKASAFIVMAIMGGALLPKAMGYVADQYRYVPRLHRAGMLLRHCGFLRI